VVSIDVLVKIGPILAEFSQECRAQQEKWGVQSHPNGTGPAIAWVDLGDEIWSDDAELLVEKYRNETERHAEVGSLAWMHILREEIAEAFAESDPRKLRAELVQAGAVIASWVEKIDRIDLAGLGEPGQG
jgi:hypothetical protein